LNFVLIKDIYVHSSWGENSSIRWHP
jgi:hypothetical protein